METDEKNLSNLRFYLKLKEAEYEASSTNKRYTHDEVMDELRKITG